MSKFIYNICRAIVFANLATILIMTGTYLVLEYGPVMVPIGLISYAVAGIFLNFIYENATGGV